MRPEDVKNWGEQWRDVEFYPGKLNIDRIIRGRSAAHFLATGTRKRSYPVFMVDFLDMVKAGLVSKRGYIDEVVVVVKRGRNFGIRAKNTPQRKKPENRQWNGIPTYMGSSDWKAEDPSCTP